MAGVRREAARSVPVVTLAPEVDGAVADRGTDPRPVRRRRLPDLVPAVVYLVGAGYVTGGLWPDLDGRVQANNVQDQGAFEFFLAHGARVLAHLSNPLFDGQVNVPAGVNMMANTSILGLSVPLAPVTLLFGPAAAYAALLVLAPALTATAWYFVLSRHVVRSRLAAAVAGGFCGFAPGLVSQSNGHPNVATQFLVPLILLQVAKLRTG